MRIAGTLIEDTYAEAFTMRAARLIITADSERWALTAALPRVDDLGDEHHGADLAAVTTGFRSLGHDDVDAEVDLPLGVGLGADQRADEDAVLVRLVDDVLGRRTEGVDEHLHERMLE